MDIKLENKIRGKRRETGILEDAQIINISKLIDEDSLTINNINRAKNIPKYLKWSKDE